MRDTLKDNEERMLNAALGLCGEAAEVWAAVGIRQPKLELGDLVWYVAQMCKSQGWSLDTFVPIFWDDLDYEDPLLTIFVHCGFIADMTKKRYFHERPVDQPQLQYHLRTIVSAIYAVAKKYGLDMEAVYDANNKKLWTRHPNGFSPESANARADETTL